MLPPLKVLLAVKPKRPAPALVSVTSVPAITPVYTLSPDWVIDKLRPLAKLSPPLPVNVLLRIVMLPVLLLVVVRPAFKLTAPPFTSIGPATLAAPTVMLAVLVDLPKRKLAAPLVKLRLVVSSGAVKAAPTDSITTAPVVVTVVERTPSDSKAILSACKVMLELLFNTLTPSAPKNPFAVDEGYKNMPK